MKIYLATSWRNPFHSEWLKGLRVAGGYEVYDFKDEKAAFGWCEISTNELDYRAILSHPLARRAQTAGRKAIEECDVLVLLLPCGQSAHFEAGYALGLGKPVFVLVPNLDPPLKPGIDYPLENLHGIANDVCLTGMELKNRLEECETLLRIKKPTPPEVVILREDQQPPKPKGMA